jgi:transcription initiation factor TFIIIB Brf1 subunit/transcription initiation factor TFIIB
MGLSLLLSLVALWFLPDASPRTANAALRAPATQPLEQLELKSKTLKSIAQEQRADKASTPKKAAPKARKAADKSASAKSPPARLPRYYSQLDLEDDQQQKLRELQQQFARQLADLREQIAKLQKERDDQLEAVLKPAQKRRLKELRTEATPAKKP